MSGGISFPSLALIATFLVYGCGESPAKYAPVSGERINSYWVNVIAVVAEKDLSLPVGKEMLSRASSAGLTEADISAGRLLVVGCGFGPGLISRSYIWKSLAYMPAGMTVRPNQVLQMAILDSGDDPSGRNSSGLLRINPIEKRIDTLNVPGTSPAYRIIWDWKEKGLSSNIEWLKPSKEQGDHFTVVGGEFVVKCQQ